MAPKKAKIERTSRSNTEGINTELEFRSIGSQNTNPAIATQPTLQEQASSKIPRATPSAEIPSDTESSEATRSQKLATASKEDDGVVDIMSELGNSERIRNQALASHSNGHDEAEPNTGLLSTTFGGLESGQATNLPKARREKIIYPTLSLKVEAESIYGKRPAVKPRDRLFSQGSNSQISAPTKRHATLEGELRMFYDMLQGNGQDLESATSYSMGNTPDIQAAIKSTKALIDEDGDDEDAEEEVTPRKRKSGGGTKWSGLDESHPPMSRLSDIFRDIAARAQQVEGFKEFLSHIQGRNLRIGTVCSGTESPILALNLVNEGKYLTSRLV